MKLHIQNIIYLNIGRLFVKDNIFLQNVNTLSDVELSLLLSIIIQPFSFQMTENVLQTLFLLQTFFLSVDLIGPSKSLSDCNLFSLSYFFIEFISELQKC